MPADQLSSELHKALAVARAAREATEAEALAAARAVADHQATAPSAFDQDAAEAALARAVFLDRVDGSGGAAALRASQETERKALAEAAASHTAERDRLAKASVRAQRELEAADRAIAELVATRTAAVAAAAQVRLEAERSSYVANLRGLIAGAQRIAALKTIVTEPSRDPRQARQFTPVALNLPALGAVDVTDAWLREVGCHLVQEGDGHVSVAPDTMVDRAREEFAALTDGFCGVIA